MSRWWFTPAVIYPSGSNVLADPAVLIAQNISGVIDEFPSSGGQNRTGTAVLVSNAIPEPLTAGLGLMSLAGLAMAATRRK